MAMARLALLGLLGRALALIVTENSPCARMCGNVPDATTVKDIECNQDAYSYSDNGLLYEQCLRCEMTSPYASPTNETDQHWMLYNLRFAASSCLFNAPEHDNHLEGAQCITIEACGRYADALSHRILSNSAPGFDYCDHWPTEDFDHFEKCTECLHIRQPYLANFFTILQGGCEQRPAPGVTVGFEGDPFSDDVLALTAPTPIATIDPDWFDQGPLNLEAKAGVAAGGFVLLLIIIGFCIIWRGKRKRRAFLRSIEGKYSRTKAWPQTAPLRTGTHEMNETPLSQKPLRGGWDDSPVSQPSDTFPRYFSPYSSQYNSPVSAPETPMPNWPVMGHAQPQVYPQAYPQDQNIGFAVSGDDGGSKKGKEREREEEYEMQNVDAYGRQEYAQHYPPPPQQQFHEHQWQSPTGQAWPQNYHGQAQ